MHWRLALAAWVIIAIQRAVLLGLTWAHVGSIPVFKWDANWYQRIERFGYAFPTPWDRPGPPSPSSPSLAFFPLLPYSARWLHQLTGLGLDPALELAALLWLPLAVWGIVAVAAEITDRKTALYLVALWGAAPKSLVTLMPYTETPFTALAAWSLMAMLRRRWWLSALLCAVAGLTRSSAAVLAVCLGISWLHHLIHDGRQTLDGDQIHRAPWWRGLWDRKVLTQGAGLAAVSMSGLAGYATYVAIETGHWDGYLRVQREWHMSMGSPLSAMEQIPAIWGHHSPWVAYRYAVIVSVLALFLAMAAVVARPPMPVAAYTIVSTLWAWAAQGFFWAKPRFLLPVFSLGLLPAKFLARAPNAVGIPIVAVLTLTGSWADAYQWAISRSP